MRIVQNLLNKRLGVLFAAFLLPFFIISCDGNAEMPSKQVDINEISDGYNIIFRRIEQLDYETVNALLDAGVDINIRGFNGMTPAIWAAGADSWIMVEMLANRGADLSLSDNRDTTVAIHASITTELKGVRPGSANERSFENVKQILRERGLY